MHRAKRAANDKCPACIHIITETDWHILNCPSRSPWRTELLQTLSESLTSIHHIQLNLVLILLQGIQGALTNQYFQMNSNNCTPIVIPNPCQLLEQNWMATSSSRPMQQTLDSDSGTARSRMTQQSTTRNKQETGGLNSSCITSGLTYGNSNSLAMMTCMAVRKTKKNANNLKGYTHVSTPCILKWICS